MPNQTWQSDFTHHRLAAGPETFKARRDLDMLFVAVDIEHGSLMTAWLVPSHDFAATLTKPNSKGRFKFTASMKATSKYRWVPYRRTSAELAPQILQRLAELDNED